MIPIHSRKKVFRSISIFWAGFIILLALQPERRIAWLVPNEVMRSISHAFSYGVLAYFLAFYLVFKRRIFGIPMTLKNVWILSLGVVFLLGSCTEWIQQFTPDRISDLADLFYDLTGGVIGLASFVFLRRSKSPNPPAQK